MLEQHLETHNSTTTCHIYGGVLPTSSEVYKRKTASLLKPLHVECFSTDAFKCLKNTVSIKTAMINIFILKMVEMTTCNLTGRLTHRESSPTLPQISSMLSFILGHSHQSCFQ